MGADNHPGQRSHLSHWITNPGKDLMAGQELAKMMRVGDDRMGMGNLELELGAA